MTDDQIRLYAEARVVVPVDVRLSVIAERTSGGGTLYTLILDPPRGKRRWFAIHSATLGHTTPLQRHREMLRVLTT